MKLRIYTDGASRGNPGNAALAYRIMEEDKVLEEKGEYVGVTTNNEAEYKALVRALKEAIKYSPSEVECVSDSKLIISQVKGEWKLNAPNLKDYFSEIKKLEKNFKKVTYKHVSRENVNVSRCDELANNALDTK